MNYTAIDHDIRAELLELPNWYADGLNINNPDQFAGSFAEDSVWDVSAANPEWIAVGRDAIKRQYAFLRGAHNWVFQVVYHSVIHECDGDRAKVRTYVGELGNLRGEGILLFAAYHDDCVRTPSGWLFANRKFDPLYHGTPDLNQDIKTYPTPNRF